VKKSSATVVVHLIALTLRWILFTLFALYMHHVTIAVVFYLRYKALIKDYSTKNPFFVRFWNNKKSNVRFKYEDWFARTALNEYKRILANCQTKKRKSLFQSFIWMFSFSRCLLPETTIFVPLTHIIPGVDTAYCTKKKRLVLIYCEWQRNLANTLIFTIWLCYKYNSFKSYEQALPINICFISSNVWCWYLY
jgi:hypothetical protein